MKGGPSLYQSPTNVERHERSKVWGQQKYVNSHSICHRPSARKLVESSRWRKRRGVDGGFTLLVGVGTGHLLDLNPRLLPLYLSAQLSQAFPNVPLSGTSCAFLCLFSIPLMRNSFPCSSGGADTCSARIQKPTYTPPPVLLHSGLYYH